MNWADYLQSMGYYLDGSGNLFGPDDEGGYQPMGPDALAWLQGDFQQKNPDAAAPIASTVQINTPEQAAEFERQRLATEELSRWSAAHSTVPDNDFWGDNLRATLAFAAAGLGMGVGGMGGVGAAEGALAGAGEAASGITAADVAATAAADDLAAGALASQSAATAGIDLTPGILQALQDIGIPVTDPLLKSVASGATGGGIKSGVTGGDPIEGALMGGALGGLSFGISDLTSGLTPYPIANQMIGSGALSGIVSGATGGDPLQGAVSGAVSGGIGSVAGTLANDLTGIPLLDRAIGSAGGSAVYSGIQGGDPIQAALNSAASSGLRAGQGAVWDASKNLWVNPYTGEQTEPQALIQTPDSYWTATAAIDTGTMTSVGGGDPLENAILGPESGTVIDVHFPLAGIGPDKLYSTFGDAKSDLGSAFRDFTVDDQGYIHATNNYYDQLNSAVSDGVITQDQADAALEHMAIHSPDEYASAVGNSSMVIGQVGDIRWVDLSGDPTEIQNKRDAISRAKQELADSSIDKAAVAQEQERQRAAAQAAEAQRQQQEQEQSQIAAEQQRQELARQQAAESARIAAEQQAQAAAQEQARVSAEQARVRQEQAAAEAARIAEEQRQAELRRQQEEAAKVAEAQRQEAEHQRQLVEQEQARQQAATQAAAAESARVAAEQQATEARNAAERAAAAEAQRIAAEQAKQAEDARIAAERESQRIAAEQEAARQAEMQRVAQVAAQAEQQRQSEVLRQQQIAEQQAQQRAADQAQAEARAQAEAASRAQAEAQRQQSEREASARAAADIAAQEQARGQAPVSTPSEPLAAIGTGTISDAAPVTGLTTDGAPQQTVPATGGSGNSSGINPLPVIAAGGLAAGVLDGLPSGTSDGGSALQDQSGGSPTGTTGGTGMSWIDDLFGIQGDPSAVDNWDLQGSTPTAPATMPTIDDSYVNQSIGPDTILSGNPSSSAQDTLGLMQMGRDAGLTGVALQQFVASGGRLGSTAAGGGGVGGGAGGSATGGAGGAGGSSNINIYNQQNAPTSDMFSLSNLAKILGIGAIGAGLGAAANNGLGGSTTSTQTKVTPPMSQEELDLIKLNSELARRQLASIDQLQPLQKQLIAAAQYDLTNQQATSSALNNAISPEQQAALAKAEFDRSQRLGPIQDQLLQRQMDIINSNGAATPEQLARTRAAADAAIEAGTGDINTQIKRGIGLISDEVANARGLRLTDTPILREATLLTDRGNDQIASLVRAQRANEAQANLTYPLQVNQQQSSMIQGQQTLNDSAKNFQDQLRQQANANRMAIIGQSSGTGIGLANTGNSSAALNALTSARLASGTTATDTSQGIGLTGIGQLAGGIGNLLSATSRM